MVKIKYNMNKLVLLFVFTSGIASAQTDWSGTAANILYRHCTSCHHQGGIAPFSLMTYSDAFQNSSDIEDVILSGAMPPWPPDPQYTRFAHERVLTQQERTALLDWVAQGALAGDTNLALTPPVYSGLSEITNPDLVSRIPNYLVNTSSDLYRCFVIPSSLPTDQYITELEALPGNREIVHHILIYEDTSSIPVQLDSQDPDPGYTNFGGTGSIYSKLVGVWVPGQQVTRMPAGMGIKLSANTNIILQIHYPGGTLGKTDSTEIRFKLTSTALREVAINPPLNHYQLDNGPLFIPANTTKTFTSQYLLPFEASILAVGPHMHLIGKSVTSYGVTPTQDTIPFIHIPEWDFHWQGTYTFPRILRLPIGTTLYGSAFYDNTAANHHNPNHPPQNVALGESTTDEMMLIYFAYTPYQAGDENIVQDSSIILENKEINYSGIVSSPQLYSPYPNPAGEKITIQFLLPEKSKVNLTLCDHLGRIVWRSNENQNRIAGYHSVNVPLSNLSSGVYTFSLETSKHVRSKKIVIE